MDRKFGNHEIFQNIDAGEGFMPLKSRNSLAGAISMPAAPRPGWGPDRRGAGLKPPQRKLFDFTHTGVHICIYT